MVHIPQRSAPVAITQPNSGLSSVRNGSQAVHPDAALTSTLEAFETGPNESALHLFAAAAEVEASSPSLHASSPSDNARFRMEAAMSRSLPSSAVSVPFPPYMASLFGAAAAEDEHVTVWDPVGNRTIAGNAAPYRRNLAQWLEAHPGWEEKADELKSSKRRSAARRAKAAAVKFAMLCQNTELARRLLSSMERRLAQLGEVEWSTNSVAHNTERASDAEWSPEEYVRMEEALVRLSEDMMFRSYQDPQKDSSSQDTDDDCDCWSPIVLAVGGDKGERDVLKRARTIMSQAVNHSSRTQERPIEIPSNTGRSLTESRGLSVFSLDRPSAASSTAFLPADLPSLSLPPPSVSFLERSFRAPREPRITVWDPSTGRTVSGNAAPCRRNLEQWMASHPGWEIKSEEHLSSSRRARNRKSSLSAASSASNTPAFGPRAAPEFVGETSLTPALSAALEGLLLIQQSPALRPISDPRATACAESSTVSEGSELELAAGSEDDTRVRSTKRRVDKGIVVSISADTLLGSGATETVEMDHDMDGDHMKSSAFGSAVSPHRSSVLRDSFR